MCMLLPLIFSCLPSQSVIRSISVSVREHLFCSFHWCFHCEITASNYKGKWRHVRHVSFLLLIWVSARVKTLWQPVNTSYSTSCTREQIFASVYRICSCCSRNWFPPADNTRSSCTKLILSCSGCKKIWLFCDRSVNTGVKMKRKYCSSHQKYLTLWWKYLSVTWPRSHALKQQVVF